jgi:hypothetical protein
MTASAVNAAVYHFQRGQQQHGGVAHDEPWWGRPRPTYTNLCGGTYRRYPPA